MEKKDELLKRYKNDAVSLVTNGHVKSIEFSGATYQSEVFDSTFDKSYWPFIQFNRRNALKDAFCSCDAVDENGGCLHVAATILKIYGSHPLPLHARFETSLYHALCSLCAQHFGYATSLVKQNQSGEYVLKGAFGFMANTEEAKQKARTLFEKRPKENEENSLKFSNLDEEEIQRWKEGRARFSLLYELSFWGDLAKWLMLLHEDKPPNITFEYDQEEWPCHVFFIFDAATLHFEIQRDDLEKVIPTLTTLSSPLVVVAGGGEGVEKVSYDNQAQRLTLHQKKAGAGEVVQKTPAIEIGPWDYIPKKGFFSRTAGDFGKKSVIEKKEIASFLDQHAGSLKEQLAPIHILEEPHSIRYALWFDVTWQLHISSYLFDKGDLAQEGAAFFGSWVYVPDKGFVKIETPLFDQQERVYPTSEVSSFVTEHRIWLSDQRGFETHVIALESTLDYRLTDHGLIFESAFIKQENAKDFGDWIFIQGEGFFSKKRKGELTIGPATEVRLEEIASFIRRHRIELETISCFFATSCPLKERGLALSLQGNHHLMVEPKYIPLDAYKNIPLLFFDEFVFIKGQGFYELPHAMQIKAPYNEATLLSQEATSAFLQQELPQLQHSILSLDPKLKQPQMLDLEVDYLVRTTQRGLKGQFYYRTENGKISLTAIIEALEQKRPFLFTDAGRIDLADERLRWLRLGSWESEKASNTLFLSMMEFLKIEVSETILSPQEEPPFAEQTKQVLKELRSFASYEPPNLKGLKSDLRLYQKSGLSWLLFLYQNGLSGLLCDEMGLGKTHQAMALTEAVMNQSPKRSLKVLVVCPTSVIYHWEDKLARFLPDMKVHIFYGQKRTLKKVPKRGVLLTSYGVLRSEIEEISKIEFELAIFDEIQIAKNRSSRIHRALARVKPKMVVGLTGTPIENDLTELKSLFDLALPSYMPSEKVYREEFVIPIEKQGNVEKKAFLKALIHPFILRRKKREVLEELPAKIEEKAYCDLSQEQTAEYKNILQSLGKPIVKDLRDKKRAVSFIHIFALLSKLKQVCNHPALLAKDPENYKNYTSGKWNLFVELMDEAMESGQKVVVFSQFLHMLDIIKAYAKEKGWGFAEIRGNTVDRKEEMRRFQEELSCRLFIGSLGAAGLGIDLTAASTVVLYDRWWNSARENQAIDRVHRIGQKWGVQVFKLITKQTIEERIDQLIEKKGALMEEIVSSEDQQTIKTLTRKELINLLSI